MDNPTKNMLPAENARALKLRRITVTALFVALASALRLVKHVTVGPMQFVNFPAIFTILSGLMFGYKAGLFVGGMSFIVSDILIGSVGPWTAFTSLSMAFIGAMSPIMRRLDVGSSMIGLAVSSFLLILIYDIISSLILLIPLVPLETAFIWAIAGLFLPSSITFYPVGLVTEIVTVALILLIYPKLKKAWIEVRF